MHTCPPPDSAPQASVTTITVLVVDDNVVNRAVLRRMIETTGATVQEATNGLEGFQMMTAYLYDLVLMDYHMPVMNGIEATERAISQGIRTPIVAVTASAEPDLKEKCLRAGMVEYLTKPLDVATVMRAIQDHALSSQTPRTQAQDNQ